MSQSQSQQQQDGAAGGLTGLNQADLPNYEEDQNLFDKFLKEHQISVTGDRDDDNGDDDGDYVPTAGDVNIRRVPCYEPLLQKIKDRDYLDPSNPTFLIEIPLSEIVAWDGVRGGDLAERVVKNTMRYHALFCEVIDKSLENMASSPNRAPARDTIDILLEQRLSQQAAQQQRQQSANTNNNPDGGDGGVLNDDDANANQNNGNQATEEFPPLLMRRYELHILPVGRHGSVFPFLHQHIPNDMTKAPDGVSLRTIRSHSMGRLVTVRGMIVRSSNVKPSCVVATYTCDACGAEVYQVLAQKREFLPQRTCPGCDSRKDSLHLQTRGSKFIKFQELKLQELPSQVPMGHVPRSMSVYCLGELTRLASPGDVVTIDGVFLPQRIAESGYRAMKAGLISTTFLEAQNIHIHKTSFEEEGALSEEAAAKLEADIQAVANSEDPIGALSAGIAPEIFGHEDIKRSLLLQLVGGCTRKLPDGMRIRGDINICLMGDPGVAKSQLLKHVASVAPRGVYTTGKGSSGVGLTAAVTKDLATGEMALEGGALVLADRGICAIDEFDKMDESDRTAIHEVMEQQTVSIAKAGIVATLNARAAVLAAANPLYGRYNRKKSLSENINLPNSLLSRFDLMFLILDTADVDRDLALARHVTFVHQNEGLKKSNDKSKDGKEQIDDNDEESDDSDDEDSESPDKVNVTPQVLREYISRASKHNPVVSPDVAPYIVEAYVNLRLSDRPGRGNKSKSTSGDQTAMTARQLLSILRLSQSLARLRFSDYVAREDVDEAIRLTHMSKASLEDHENALKSKRKRGEDVTSKIFTILRDYAASTNASEADLKMCEAMALRKGYTAEQLSNCLEEYEELNVIQVNANRTHVHFLTG